MSPEQVSGERELAPTSDVYAATAVLWEMVCSERLFGGTHAQALLKILRGEPRDPREVVPELPEAHAAIILRGLSREPHDRYPDAAEMAAALEGCGPAASPQQLADFMATIASAAAPTPSSEDATRAPGKANAREAHGGGGVIDLASVAQRHADGSVTFSEVARRAAATPRGRRLFAVAAVLAGCTVGVLIGIAPWSRPVAAAQAGLAGHAFPAGVPRVGVQAASTSSVSSPGLTIEPAGELVAPGRSNAGSPPPAKLTSTPPRSAHGAERPGAAPAKPPVSRKDGLFDRD